MRIWVLIIIITQIKATSRIIIKMMNNQDHLKNAESALMIRTYLFSLATVRVVWHTYTLSASRDGFKVKIPCNVSSVTSKFNKK